MKKIYISGRITGNKNYLDDFTHAHNVLTVKFPTARIVNPLFIVKEPFADWLECMKADIKALVDCDAIYMLKGWSNSKGAMLEFIIAKYLDMQIIFEEGPNE